MKSRGGSRRRCMKDFVNRATAGYSKIKGQLVCNQGAQEREISELLLAHGYNVINVTAGSCKKRKCMLKYYKERW